MTTFAILVLLVALGAVFWGSRYPSQLPQPFHARPCQGKFWKDTFPSSTKAELRAFLAFFVAAFAFSEKDMFKFNPTDTILQIYRAIYPSKWTPDALEVETLAKDFELKYGVRFESIWHDGLSLGELFIISRGNTQQ
jgi:hypothetical protein